MPKVWQVHDKNMPRDTVYVGRPTIWGNPFPMKDQSLKERDRVIQAYTEWLLAQPELVKRAKQELSGKDLACWCAPMRCHADVLLKLANAGIQGDESNAPKGP